MANQTVTSNTDLETVIGLGLNDGENITINNGAVLTCTEKPSKLIGYVFINDGTFHIDGTNISAGNLINFVGRQGGYEVRAFGLGEFKVTGDWFSIGTTNGTDSQAIDLSAYWGGSHEDVVPAIWVETGRRIDFDGESGDTPLVNDWVYKSSDKTVFGRIVEVQPTYLVVKYLTGSFADNEPIEIRKVTDNFGPDFLTTWTALVNNPSGDIKEAGIYQEFGNTVSNGTSTIATFSNKSGGFVFEHIWQSNTLTMGSNAAGGFVPPSGCDIRVPNVHVSTSDLTPYASGDTSVNGNQELHRYGVYTVSSGVVDLNICNYGSGWAADTGARRFKCQYVGACISLGSSSTSGELEFKNCVVIYDPISTAFSLGTAFCILDISNGILIEDSMVINGCIAQNWMGGTNSRNITIKNCIISRGSGPLIQASLNSPVFISSCANVTMDNNIVYNSDHANANQAINIAAITNLKLTNTKICCTQTETAQNTESDAFTISSNTNNSEIIGVEVIGDGYPGATFFDINDSFDMKFRCMGMIDEKLVFSSDADYLVWIKGLSSNLDFARMWKDGTGVGTGHIAAMSTTQTNILFTNVSGYYLSEIENLGNKTLFRGVHGGGGNFNSNPQGIEGNTANSFGSNWNDNFRNDTTGSLYLIFQDKAPDTPNNYTVVTGSPAFDQNGQMNMDAGDVIEFEMQYFAKGHTGFSGSLTKVVGAGQHGIGSDSWLASITPEFQYDTGSGYNGTWLDLNTPANLTAITGMIGGIKLKVRLTCNTDINSVSGLVIYTTTTIADQKANLFPIDQNLTTLKLSGIKNNTEVRVCDTTTQLEIAGEESVTTGEFIYEYTHSVDRTVDVIIHALGYEHERIRDLVLSDSDITIPIQQRVDRQYNNP